MVIEKVQGDEPTKYIDSKTSREESIQKRFYIQGLYKKQRRFSRAVDHLVHSQFNCDDNNNTDDIVSEPTCNKIDMSKIDFGNKRIATNDNNADNKQN